MEEELVGEVDEVRLCCVVGVGAVWVTCGAVAVERTVKGLLDVIVDGPAEEKENEVGVVVMPGMDTKISQ